MIEQRQPKTGAAFWVTHSARESAGRARVKQSVVDVPFPRPFEALSFDEGLRAGARARLRREPITAYQRVGLDDFARGFRAGYFANRARGLDVSESG